MEKSLVWSLRCRLWLVYKYNLRAKLASGTKSSNIYYVHHLLAYL